MPPPPPPSKSYHIRIVDSDDSDEEERSRASFSSAVEPPPPPPPTTVPKFETQELRASLPDDSDDDHADRSDDTSQDDQSALDTSLQDAITDESPTKRKRRKRKKNRKKKAQQPARRITFGSVSVREFNRCLGTDVLPGYGGWPLGMSRDVYQEFVDTETVDEYEVVKQSRLKTRWKELHKEDETAEPPDWLETRQRDYKSKSKNPLFRMLQENDRMILLLSGERDVISAPALTRTRSGSMDKVVHSTRSRSRSGSFDKRGHQTRARSASFAEQFNDDYQMVDVHHVRNELEQLRNSRSTEGNTGCTCRKLDVYLLPPGGGGKKAHNRRMNERKVKLELQKRHLLPTESKSRDELELLLHDIVAREPCCSIDCSCVRNGIECQSDTCQCWYTSHQAEKGKNSADLPSVDQIRTRCGNEYGMYTVDAAKIDAFRSGYICPVIEAEDCLEE